MLYKIQLSVLALFMSLSAQSQDIRPDLSSFDIFLNEVYTNEGKIESDSRKYKYLKEMYQNRLIFRKLKSEEMSKIEIKDISEVELNTVYNNHLSRNNNFNIKTFNPFKYNINFYSKSIQIFKLENTNYFFVIYPQVISSLNRPY